jgi:DNA (cytosine-5)-methyltransferase 1
MARPTVGSLFTGIGGIDLGLERAGFRVAWMCERDAYCQRVLTKHWPGVPIYDDATNLPDDVERVDVLTAGFPCQPVSYAGRRNAQQDERWLWPYVQDCISVLRPRGVLLENVPGLITAGFDDVLGGLAACGYDAEWDCIPAAAVGAPHLRDRIFVIATPCDAATDSAHGGWDDPMAHADIHGPCGTIGAEMARPQTRGGGPYPEAARPSGGRQGATVSDTTSTGPQGHGGHEWPNPCGHLAARSASDGKGAACAVADADDSGNRTPGRGDNGRAAHDERWEGQSLSGPSGCGATMADASGFGQPRQGEPIHTGHSAADGEGETGQSVHDGVRNVWPPEPDVGRVADGIPARVDRLRALGNAVVPQVAEYVGHQLARIMGVPHGEA